MLRRTVTAGIVSALERSSSELGISTPRQAFVQVSVWRSCVCVYVCSWRCRVCVGFCSELGISTPRQAIVQGPQCQQQETAPLQVRFALDVPLHNRTDS